MGLRASVVLLVASLSYAAGVTENVAQGKPAWMSTTRLASLSASNAVDGVTTAINETYSVHTNVNEPSAWWKVDLQTSVQSPLVNIYFRTDYKRRRNGLQLYTSRTNSSDPKEGNLCYTVVRPDGTDIPDVLSVTCPGTWRYLTIYTETDNDGSGAVLDFAEVQVWVSRACASEYYGVNCGQPCDARHCKMTSVCDAASGQCVGGCAAGYQGTDCTQVCSSGRYGEGCSKSCSSRYCKMRTSTCDHVTGRCPDGCAAGYTGEDCLQTCESGVTYGDTCSKYCSSRHCLNMGGACPPDTGACSACHTGWAGADCTVCAAGYYGANCNQLCSNTHCTLASPCGGIQWSCGGGCAAGYHGQYCTQACSSGNYGANCVRRCDARHCRSSAVCDAIQGQCVGGCAAGYQGTDCRQDCDPGMYGDGCRKTCSSRHCKTLSDRCDHVTGKCPDGCITGFTGDDCLQRNCPDGYYGTNCSLSCADRHCSSSSCPADGACDAECEAGWALPSCTQECPRGKYGVSCNSVCGHCADNVTCHHITGTCPGGCEAGWKHPLCHTACGKGTYGLNCEGDCGQCNGTCDAVDGRCPWGCTKGYNGSYCSGKLSSLTDSDSAITPVTAGIIGLAAGICLMVVLGGGILFGLVRQGRLLCVTSSQKDEVKLRATSTQVNSTQPPDNYTSISEQASGRNIYDNDYSTLDVEAKSNNDYDVIKNKAYENM